MHHMHHDHHHNDEASLDADDKYDGSGENEKIESKEDKEAN